MPRTRAIRVLVIALCVGGIVGMIVTSATDHNGAAITFGLVTAVAVLCQMVATTVVNELTGAPGAPIAGPWTHRPEPRVSSTEEQAAEVETRINALVTGGSDEAAVRDLVRSAVRLGRQTAGTTTAVAPDS